MLDLPHKAPIRFAQTVSVCTDQRAVVRCVFPYPPSLGMVIEAAAQASISLAKTPAKGFLAGANQVEQLKQTDKQTFDISVSKLYEIEAMTLFAFVMEDYAKGKFAIYAQ